MTGWELGNCRRYGLDPIVVLFNNASWEMLRAFQPQSRFNDLDDWNFAAIASSLGSQEILSNGRRARQTNAQQFEVAGVGNPSAMENRSIP
jgi:TPP-dependent 2-oxoacid decarboxylase